MDFTGIIAEYDPSTTAMRPSWLPCAQGHSVLPSV